MPRRRAGRGRNRADPRTLGWPHPAFEIPADIYEGWSAKETGAEYEAEWNDRFENYRREFPELAAEFERRIAGELPTDWAEKSPLSSPPWTPRPKPSPAAKPRKTPSTASARCCLNCWAAPPTWPAPT